MLLLRTIADSPHDPQGTEVLTTRLREQRITHQFDVHQQPEPCVRQSSCHRLHLETAPSVARTPASHFLGDDLLSREFNKQAADETLIVGTNRLLANPQALPILRICSSCVSNSLRSIGLLVAAGHFGFGCSIAVTRLDIGGTVPEARHGCRDMARPKRQ